MHLAPSYTGARPLVINPAGPLDWRPRRLTRLLTTCIAACGVSRVSILRPHSARYSFVVSTKRPIKPTSMYLIIG